MYSAGLKYAIVISLNFWVNHCLYVHQTVLTIVTLNSMESLNNRPGLLVQQNVVLHGIRNPYYNQSLNVMITCSMDAKGVLYPK